MAAAPRQLQYLWDHRNQSLRTFLIDEFVLNAKTGLGNPHVDGFFFDDGWTNKPASHAGKPGYEQCDMAQGGGATEENFYCTKDMGLSADDVRHIYTNWSLTIARGHAAVLAGGGLVFQQTIFFAPRSVIALTRVHSRSRSDMCRTARRQLLVGGKSACVSHSL